MTQYSGQPAKQQADRPKFDKSEQETKSAGEEMKRKREEMLDEASRESFPASDPPAWITHDPDSAQ